MLADPTTKRSSERVSHELFEMVGSINTAELNRPPEAIGEGFGSLFWYKNPRDVVRDGVKRSTESEIDDGRARGLSLNWYDAEVFLRRKNYCHGIWVQGAKLAIGRALGQPHWDRRISRLR